MNFSLYFFLTSFKSYHDKIGNKTVTLIRALQYGK